MTKILFGGLISALCFLGALQAGYGSPSDTLLQKRNNLYLNYTGLKDSLTDTTLRGMVLLNKALVDLLDVDNQILSKNLEEALSRTITLENELALANNNYKSQVSESNFRNRLFLAAALVSGILATSLIILIVLYNNLRVRRMLLLEKLQDMERLFRDNQERINALQKENAQLTGREREMIHEIAHLRLLLGHE